MIVMLLKQKIIVNIDKDQLNNLNIKFDLKILDDVTNFANYLIKQKISKKLKNYIVTKNIIGMILNLKK